MFNDDVRDYGGRQDMLRAITGFTEPTTTPICCRIASDYGEIVGTGNYVQLRGSQFILTNHHVALMAHDPRLISRATDHITLLTYLLDDHTAFQPIHNDFICFRFPVDAALVRIDSDNITASSKRPLQSSCF